MDEVDKVILGMLKENSRISNVEIAKKIGLSEGGVRHRIQTLYERGIIKKFTIDIASPNSLFAVVMVKSKGETKKMMAEIVSSGVSDARYEISGEFDATIILSASSMDELDRKVDSIRACFEVADTKTFISFKQW